MITREEFITLTSEEVHQAIAQAVHRDPLDIALDRKIPHARLVASQVKYLQRAARKLPHYAQAQCIIPSLAFEQSSSEACAMTKSLHGKRVLDLTCGLGVDAWYLSRQFDHVVTIERDALLAEVARENFRRLGAENIEVVNASSEDYVCQTTEHFDWIYADPDRRGQDGRKKVCLEDCSPNMITLMPRLRELANGICIKNSPLFDIDEAFRLFGACHVEVLSHGDECKEVVIYLQGEEQRLTATAIGQGSYTTLITDQQITPPAQFLRDDYRWLIVPDVSLQKARLARQAISAQADIWTENGFAFATAMPHDILGRVFQIESIDRYDPRTIKRQYKGMKAEIWKRDFPLRTEEVMRRTGLRAGSDLRLALTKIGNDYWTIRLKTK